MIGADLIRSLSPVFVTQQADSFISAAALAPKAIINFAPHYIQTPVNVNIFIPDQGTHYSVFGSSSFQLMDDLKLEVGARYQIYRTHQQSDLSVVAAGNTVETNVPTISPGNSMRTYHAFTGGANLRYTITPDHNAYVSYNHSFRPGSSAVGVTTVPPLSDSLTLSKPETSDAVELGLKSSFFDHRLSVNTDVFYQHFNGFINLLVVNAASAGNGIINASPTLTFNGDAESEGIETQVNAVVTDGWDVGLNASWANAQYTNAVIPCNTFTAGGAATVPVGQQISTCPSDGRIGETPKFHLTLQSEYHYDIGEYQPFISGLFTYQPGWHSSINNYDYQDLPILNLYAGVRDEDAGWDFTVFAKNLSDIQRIRNIAPADYQQSTSVVDVYNHNALAAAAPFDSGYRPVETTLPREVGVTLRYRFGGSPSEPESTPAAYTPPPVQAPAPSVARSYMVFFDFNKSDLTPQAVEIVDQAAKNAAPAKVTQLTVTGHTDTVGSDAYNMRLSKRRAESVASQLEKDGIPSNEIEIVAKGKRDLLVPTKDGVREPQNRRVQIVYSGGPTS
jgi:iron complex outermembrane receptor protein